jgi:putative hydrolase
MGDMWGDAPLFRELQRVLSASGGPVNWELARQVGIATASFGDDDPPPTEDDRRELVDAVRLAELSVADLTALPMPSDLAEVRAIRRAEWVEANIRSLDDMIDPVASKLAASLEGLAGEDVGGPGALPGIGFGPPGQSSFDPGAGLQDPDVPGGGPAVFGQLMGTLAPLLMGAQVGTALGSVAQRAMGQYDLALPRKEGTLLFVTANIARFESDWSLPRREVRTYVALHEVVHRFEFAQPWVRPNDLVRHAEVDVAGLQQRLESLDPTDPDAMREAMAGTGNLFDPAQSDPEQRLRIARLQAFLAAAEGYGDHVTKTIGHRMLPSFDRIEEALIRHREGRGSEGALEQLLGLEVSIEQYRLGEDFCTTVVRDADEATLSRMWGSAESLPSMPELEEPTLWLSRTV